MALGTIRPATPEDINYISENVRASDKVELEYSSPGKSVKEIILDTPDLFAQARVWDVGDGPACIFGVTDVGRGQGLPWMIAAKHFSDHKLSFAHQCTEVVEGMMSNYDMLYNYVYAGHDEAIKWLKWLGFKFDTLPIPVGENGAPFVRFWKNAYV